MKQKIEGLCRDPLFQLNLAIWLAQPKIEDTSIRPVLYQSGFRILSIGPLLTLPPDIRLITRQSGIDCQDIAKPELILEANNRTKLLIVECKRSSFGSSSSTAEQTRTLLLLSGRIIAEVLAIGARSSAQGILCYLTGSDQVALLEGTLTELAQELQKVNFDTGDRGCLGIKPSDTGILLEYSEKMKSLLNLQSVSPTMILTVEEGTDPRPLYFIPYDPNIEQSREEQMLSRRILYERLLAHVLSKIGPSNAPCEVTFTTEEMLISATFGVYEIWEDQETKKHLRKLLRDFMGHLKNTLNDDDRKHMKYETTKGWIFKFKD